MRWGLVMQINTRDLHFFHGTGAIAAARPLRKAVAY